MGIVEQLTGIRIECPECGAEQEFGVWFTRLRLGWKFKPLPWLCHRCRTEISFTVNGILLGFPCLLLAVLMLRLMFYAIHSAFPNIEIANGMGSILTLILLLLVIPLTLLISNLFKNTIFKVIKTKDLSN